MINKFLFRANAKNGNKHNPFYDDIHNGGNFGFRVLGFHSSALLIAIQILANWIILNDNNRNRRSINGSSNIFFLFLHEIIQSDETANKGG